MSLVIAKLEARTSSSSNEWICPKGATSQSFVIELIVQTWAVQLSSNVADDIPSQSPSLRILLHGLLCKIRPAGCRRRRRHLRWTLWSMCMCLADTGSWSTACCATIFGYSCYAAWRGKSFGRVSRSCWLGDCTPKVSCQHRSSNSAPVV